jgi:hypothetical protein
MTRRLAIQNGKFGSGELSMWTLPWPSARAARKEELRAGRRTPRRWGIVILFLLLCPTALFAEANPKTANPIIGGSLSEPLTVRGKLRYYVKATYGPGALASKAASSGLNQWLDSPDEWGQGLKGYGRRYASSMGQSTINNSIRFGIGAALREDPRYFPSERKGFLPRMGHALAYTFLTRTDSGGRAFAVSRFGGAFGSAFISNSWHPAGEDTTGDAFKRAGITLALGAGMNVFREFWPDMRRVSRRR